MTNNNNNNNYVEHYFSMGHTIEAAIRYHNPDSTVEERKILLEQFKQLNDYRNPKMGEPFKIPLLKGDE